MAIFQEAVKLTLAHEGGFNDNPSDPGGATNMGILQRDLPDINIKDLTVAQAEAYYQEHFWNPLYDQIEDQSIANKLFDLGVLFGVNTAIRLLQEALQVGLALVPDGLFGPKTLAEVNSVEPTSLLKAYKTLMVSRALAVAAQNPAERIFVQGWISRINS